ncbi:polyadenylate-binding protein-interacting protein 12-like [Senna tora]|uniref:Polyadenylate-binding protein-interacting protein 12-like n=1 Tax=Senna tora TaxID=362788 RepID=A0A834SHT5_9FABA|nr:polyadenylate-binding protein-interacting protein 12-like [Senna tora]
MRFCVLFIVFLIGLSQDFICSTLQANSAIAALNCSGVILDTLPIRVSPSKTPVRSCAPRTSMQ